MEVGLDGILPDVDILCALELRGERECLGERDNLLDVLETDIVIEFDGVVGRCSLIQIQIPLTQFIRWSGGQSSKRRKIRSHHPILTPIPYCHHMINYFTP